VYVRVCVCVCVCVCSSERSGVVLSARGGKECPNQTVNRMPRERERAGQGKETETECVSTQWEKRWRERGSRDTESSRRKGRIKGKACKRARD